MWGAKEHHRHAAYRRFELETMGIVEVVRKQLEDWKEMRKRMLAEGEERNVEYERTGRKRSFEVSKLHRSRPPPTPTMTTAAFPDL